MLKEKFVHAHDLPRTSYDRVLVLLVSRLKPMAHPLQVLLDPTNDLVVVGIGFVEGDLDMIVVYITQEPLVVVSNVQLSSHDEENISDGFLLLPLQYFAELELNRLKFSQQLDDKLVMDVVCVILSPVDLTDVQLHLIAVLEQSHGLPFILIPGQIYIQDFGVILHESLEQKFNIQLGLQPPWQLLKYLLVVFSRYCQIPVKVPPVLEELLKLGFECFTYLHVVVELSQCPEEQVEACGFFMGLIEVSEFSQHDAEVVHEEGGARHSKQHYK